MQLSSELKQVINDIAEVAQYLWQKGWAERNAGNISVDVTEVLQARNQTFRRSPKIPMKISLPELSERSFLVTVTGSRFRDFTRQPEKGLLLVGISDKCDGYHILWGEEGTESRPTKEFLPHLKIHGFLCRNGLPQKAVLHSHPNHLIALTHLKDYSKGTFNRFLLATHVGVNAFLPEGVGMAPYCPGGSEELANATVDLIEHHKVVLWEKHGCISIGNDVHDAFDNVDTVNKAAEIFLLCKSSGYEPKGSAITR